MEGRGRGARAGRARAARRQAGAGGSMGAVEDAVDDAMSARGPGGPLSYAGGPHQLAAVRKALVDARREFVSLVALTAPATLRSGKTGKLLKLEGTVPMYHRGNKVCTRVARSSLRSVPAGNAPAHVR